MGTERLKKLGGVPWTGVEKAQWIKSAKVVLEDLEDKIEALEEKLVQLTEELETYKEREATE